MPLFISDEELARHSTDASYVASKADDFIRALQNELETVKAASDASSITAEQTVSLLEQKFLSLSTEFSNLQSRKAQLQSSLDHRLSELAELQALKHHLNLQSIGKDGEIERLTLEVAELHKSKRQLLDLVEGKDLELSEKNDTVKTYFNKILKLTATAAEKEARFSELEAKLALSQSLCSRLSQEKELIEKHNGWLNDELKSKVNELIQARKSHADIEEDISSKLADAERQLNEFSSSLKHSKEKEEELSAKFSSLQEELCSTKDAAADNEHHFSAELSTVNKLVELYKESSEEWSRKAAELEGVIRALETHLSQVENDYKEKLEKEVSTRKSLQKEVIELKEKVEKYEAEVEKCGKSGELDLPLSSFTIQRWMDPFGDYDFGEDNNTMVPRFPVGISGTALAASLIRDGWSLAKMYTKYQETIDALRHEQLGRKESEQILQRVLAELEEKARVILDERVEYERMVESHSTINHKLQQSVSEQENLQNRILELKVDLKRHERENSLAHKEIVDLQKQVTVLLKECRDIQLCCGFAAHDQTSNLAKVAVVEMDIEFDADKVIAEHLLTFKDINGLVEQNVQLRTLVRSLSDQIERKEMELKGEFEMELKKHNDEAASKVAAVMQRAEEQGRMIESLHTSVAMYKRLYEEEHKHRSSHFHSPDGATAISEDGWKDFLFMLEGSQETYKKAQEKAAERLRPLEEDLEKSRSDIISLQSERDKLVHDVKFAKERFDSFMKEFEHQKHKMESLGARNVELSQLVIDFQKKLRENSEALNASEELSRKLTMEVSVLKHEKEMLSNAEKRACEEVRRLSERVYRLQATLETMQSAEEVHEEARAVERRKQEEHIQQIEREWAEAKKELLQERDNVRTLASDREQTMKNAMRQIEEMGKEWANALHAVSTAETRAAVAESKLADLEKKFATSEKVANFNGGGAPSSISSVEAVTDLEMAKKEIEKLREEVQANKEHMLQYKSIAQVNDDALKQIEAAHENFKKESQKLKESLEAQILALRERISELQKEFSLKSEEVVSAAAGQEEALTSAMADIAQLKDERASKISEIVALETQVLALKKELETEHERRREVQTNYEQQVVLQSEAIKESRRLSHDLAFLQQEVSGLRKLADSLKRENEQLKEKWHAEKSVLENAKNEAEKKYEELDEQNRILHCRVEALHIQLAERDRNSAGISSGGNVSEQHSDDGLQNVINYLRRSKEMAETEISLLKQEKLRLQTQLDSALKAAETAEFSLRAERANSRAILFSKEEIKSLQLQVRELNLLRESNMQLREENKYNFEECQKLREVAQKVNAQFDNLESQVRVKNIEIEACKKEIEMERMEKDHLARRVSELLERSRNIDVEEYDQMKDNIQQMQEQLKVKDAEIEEIKNLASRQQETISNLEQDIAKRDSELNEKEKRISNVLQIEASLKSELERQKKFAFSWKKRADSVIREKDELSKEKQTLIKQIEELKQGKRSLGSVSGEQLLKEKEEKDHRIQILERTVERQREELRKEKEDRQTEKTRLANAIENSVKSIEQAKSDYTNKLEIYKQAVQRLLDEVDKLKHAESSLPEGTSVVQLFSGSNLDDLSAAYDSAVENFRKVARDLSHELSTGDLPTEPIPDAPAAVNTGPITSHSAAKVTKEKERRISMPRASSETRKTGRKLVRPQLVRPEERQGDLEMSEADGSSTGVKASHDSETQCNLTSSSQPSVHKRIASSDPEVNEQSLNQGDTSSETAVPVSKKPKGSDSQQEGAVRQHTTPSDNPPSLPVVEEASDAVGQLPHNANEEVDAEKEEVQTTGEQPEQLEKEPEQSARLNEVELQNEKNNVEEISEKPSGSGMECDDTSKDYALEENPQAAKSEREEGELEADVADAEEGAEVSNVVESPETGEALPEGGTTPVASPRRIADEAMDIAGMELGEIYSLEGHNDEKNDEDDVIEETAEGSDKSNDAGDQIVVETDHTSEIATVTSEAPTTSTPEVDSSKQITFVATVAAMSTSAEAVGSSATEGEDVKQVSPASNSSNIVNLAARARERSALRQSGAGVLPPGRRGRGRAAPRGRGAHVIRGGRSGGRGHTPGQQG